MVLSDEAIQSMAGCMTLRTAHARADTLLLKLAFGVLAYDRIRNYNLVMEDDKRIRKEQRAVFIRHDHDSLLFALILRL